MSAEIKNSEEQFIVDQNYGCDRFRNNAGIRLGDG